MRGLAPAWKVLISPGLTGAVRTLLHVAEDRTNHAVQLVKVAQSVYVMSHNAQTIVFPAVCQGEPVTLSIDWQTGFWFNHDTREDVRVFLSTRDS